MRFFKKIHFEFSFVSVIWGVCAQKCDSSTVEKWKWKLKIVEGNKKYFAFNLYQSYSWCPLFFIKFLFFHQMIARQKLWKMLFISSKNFSFSRYSNFSISVLPSFSSCRPLLWRRSKINLKVHDAIICLNKNSITNFVWYLEKEKRYDTETLSIDGVSNKEHFYGKIMQKMCSKS